MVVDLDAKVSGLGPELQKVLADANVKWADAKAPVSSYTLAKEKPPRTLEQEGYNLGASAVRQKYRFVGRENGPETADNVLHVVDLYKLPPEEKDLMIEYVLRGAKDQGSDKLFLFLNSDEEAGFFLKEFNNTKNL
jgi:hypothetical protein